MHLFPTLRLEFNFVDTGELAISTSKPCLKSSLPSDISTILRFCRYQVESNKKNDIDKDGVLSIEQGSITRASWTGGSLGEAKGTMVLPLYRPRPPYAGWFGHSQPVTSSNFSAPNRRQTAKIGVQNKSLNLLLIVFWAVLGLQN